MSRIVSTSEFFFATQFAEFAGWYRRLPLSSAKTNRTYYGQLMRGHVCVGRKHFKIRLPERICLFVKNSKPSDGYLVQARPGIFSQNCLAFKMFDITNLSHDTDRVYGNYVGYGYQHIW